jgi:hypothetical protein
VGLRNRISRTKCESDMQKSFKYLMFPILLLKTTLATIEKFGGIFSQVRNELTLARGEYRGQFRSQLNSSLIRIWASWPILTAFWGWSRR